MIRKDELKLLQMFNKGLTALIERNTINLKYVKDKDNITFINGKIYAYKYIQLLFTRNVMIDIIKKENIK